MLLDELMPTGEGDLKKQPTPNKTEADLRLYAPFGASAQGAMDEGFYPVNQGAGDIEFRHKYGLFNIVDLPNKQQKGYMAAIGKPGSQSFKVVIKDADGNIDRVVLDNATPEMVRKYYAGMAKPRAEAMASGTNSDRPDAQGMYTSIYQ